MAQNIKLNVISKEDLKNKANKLVQLFCLLFVGTKTESTMMCKWFCTFATQLGSIEQIYSQLKKTGFGHFVLRLLLYLATFNKLN